MKLSALAHYLCLLVSAVAMAACTANGSVGTIGSADAGAGGGGGGGGGSEFADASVCLESAVRAEPTRLPVDIIWVVDTSGSMSFESSTVETNLNAFAMQIDSWGIDYQVIMVAQRGGGSDVCVPTPLAGANCGDGPRFRHVPLRVGSTNALGKLIEAYPQYQDVLRDDSSKQFVVVSDDEANNNQNDVWFRAAITGLSSPGFPARESSPMGFVFHSIVAWGDVAGRGCSTGARIGQSYLNLTELTSGVKAKVCETDWTPIFAALQAAVVEGATLPCSFDIPVPPDGQTLDPDQLNLVHTPSGQAPITIPRVDAAASCGASGGWYYDDPANPTKILVCDATCDDFDADPDGEVKMQFGCSTIVL